MEHFWHKFGGAGGSGEACLSLQILQKGEWPQSRPAPPAGVRRILRAAPSAAGPFWLRGIAIWEPWYLLFDIPGTILAPWEHLGWPFWRLGSTLGSHFGTPGPPWKTMGAAGWTRSCK